MISLDLGDSRLIQTLCKTYGLSLPQQAYVLATAYWETARQMKPVREAFWMSESWRKENLRYYPWYGRGYVQLTWEANYLRAGKALGIDLTADADRALETAPAAHILIRGMLEGWFTGKSLSTYLHADKQDFIAARRIINGTDRAADIAMIAEKYLLALREEEPQPSPWVQWLRRLFKV